MPNNIFSGLANLGKSVYNSLSNSYKQNTNANRQSATTNNKYTTNLNASATKNTSSSTGGNNKITVNKNTNSLSSNAKIGNTSNNKTSTTTVNPGQSTAAIEQAKGINTASALGGSDTKKAVPNTEASFDTDKYSNVGDAYINKYGNISYENTNYQDNWMLGNKSALKSNDTKWWSNQTEEFNNENDLDFSTDELKKYVKDGSIPDRYYSNGDDGSGSDGGTTADYTNYYNDLMNAFLEQNEADRQAAIDAILKNLDSVTGEYKQKIQEVMDDYQDQVDQLAVSTDRTRRSMRESQANRGQLGSGLGRQEQLELDVNYNNKLADLKKAQESAVNEIYNYIKEAEAEAETNKATINSNYNNARMNYQLAMAEAANS